MDMDAMRLQDSWLAQMSGVITLMAVFLPVAAWAPKDSHGGMFGTVLEEVAQTVMSKDSSVLTPVPPSRWGFPTPKNPIPKAGAGTRWGMPRSAS